MNNSTRKETLSQKFQSMFHFVEQYFGYPNIAKTHYICRLQANVKPMTLST